MDRPEDIRHEIASTRARLDGTVTALERRLAPGRIAGEAWERVSDTARSAGIGAWDRIRKNPWPLAVAGAGIGWFAVQAVRNKKNGNGTVSDEKLRSRGYGAPGGPVAPGSPRPGEAPGGRDPVGSRTWPSQPPGEESVWDTEWGLGATERELDTASSRRTKLRRKIEQARDKARDTAGRVPSRVSGSVRDRPLIFAAAAFGLGLAAAFAVPVSRAENRSVGKARDRLVHRARDEAAQAARKARRVAGNAAEAAREEADRQGLTGNWKEKARSIAGEAARAARETARRESDGHEDRRGESGRSETASDL